MVMDRKQQRRSLLEAMSRDALVAMVESLETRPIEMDAVDAVEAIIAAKDRHIRFLEEIIAGQNALLDKYAACVEKQQGFTAELMDR